MLGTLSSAVDGRCVGLFDQLLERQHAPARLINNQIRQGDLAGQGVIREFTVVALDELAFLVQDEQDLLRQSSIHLGHGNNADAQGASLTLKQPKLTRRILQLVNKTIRVSFTMSPPLSSALAS